MRRGLILVTALAVCWTMMAPAGMAGKPQPPPEPEEPLGYIDLKDGVLQLANSYNYGTAAEPDSYARLYEWDKDNKQFKHVWSATGGYGACILGDVDNDGHKELAATTVVKEVVNKNNIITKYYLKIWKGTTAARRH